MTDSLYWAKESYPTQEAAKSAGVATLNYGYIPYQSVDFFIIAIVIFFDG
jgi:large-conductance mechanosensitive channel